MHQSTVPMVGAAVPKGWVHRGVRPRLLGAGNVVRWQQPGWCRGVLSARTVRKQALQAVQLRRACVRHVSRRVDLVPVPTVRAERRQRMDPDVHLHGRRPFSGGSSARRGPRGRQQVSTGVVLVVRDNHAVSRVAEGPGCLPRRPVWERDDV